MDKKYLLDLDPEELKVFLGEMGQQKFRAKQIFTWISRGVRDFDEMTDLSKELRTQLKLSASISSLTIKRKLVSSEDGTVKYLFTLPDGNMVESVLMEYKYGLTACISSQVGCKMGCTFCASTMAGYARDLSAGEILEQITAIEHDSGKKVGNIVIMGIGEPFDNYDNVLKFLRLIHHPEGMNMGYRHITISTSGIVPGIMRFISEDIPVNLAISLHAPNDEIRRRLMPIARKYSIDKIIEACKIYTETSKRRITFEYAMFEGVNDSDGCAAELVERLKGMLCHVNLIPANPVEGTGYSQSGRRRVEEFKEILEAGGIQTTVRRELGSDINAACGQLRRTESEARRC